MRNCAITMLSFAVIFAAISIYNERYHGTADEYGRLFGKQVAGPNGDIARKTDVIKEGPVADQKAADPMLVAPAAREQILMANTNVAATTSASVIVPTPPPVVTGVRGHGTTIVGDGNGVTVVKAPATSTAPHPVLSGGIFKQQ